MANLPGLPGGAEVWRVDGKNYAVYTVPGTKIPLMYRFERSEQFSAVGSPKPDRTMTMRQAQSRGAINFGVTSELDARLGGHPWDSFLARIERDVDIAPWLADPEVVAHVGSAWLRGTTPNLERTEWWRSKTDAERQWLEKAAANPSQARRELTDNRQAIHDQLVSAGYRGPKETRAQVAKLISDNLTKGAWSTDFALSQIRKVADPFYSSGTIDDELLKMIGGSIHHGHGTREQEDRVAELTRMWLGPNHDIRGSVSQQEWAARLRLWDDGEDRLIQHLQKQRLALFPEYEDESLTYEDIASPWRGFVQQHWGMTADETDPLFSRLIKTNDAAANLTTLRREGMQRGVQQVVRDLAADAQGVFGNNIRQAI